MNAFFLSLLTSFFISSFVQAEPREFLSYFNDSNPDSVDAFVAQLPTLMRSDKKVVLAHQSHGLMPSSRTYPNIFLFGDRDINFTILYNSKRNPDHLREEMEVLNYNASEKRHELYVVTFENRQKPVIEKNPARCASCHGQDPRPLWKSPYSWPGFYGEKNSRIGDNADDLKENLKNTRVSELSVQRWLKRGFFGQQEAQPNAVLGAKLAIQHADSILHRMKKDMQVFEASRMETLKYLSGCLMPVPFADYLEQRFHIPKEVWFMNRQLALDHPDINPFYQIETSAFETGSGPMEWLMLSAMLENEISYSKKDKTRLFEILEANEIYDLTMLDAQSPSRYAVPAKRYVNGTPHPKWCASFDERYRLTHPAN